MAEFTYRGRDVAGQPVTGKLTAGSQRSALEQLRQQQVTVLGLEEAVAETQSSSAGLWQRIAGEKVKADELILFTRQLYALTKAGIPILRAINGLADSASSAPLGACLSDISHSLVSGSDLSSAFRRHPHIFSPIYISLLQVGESTGRLDAALLKLIDHLEMERETRKRMKAALRYPLMVVTAIIIAMIVITVFVIPAFSGVFEKLGAELPLATRILIAASSFVQHYGHLLFILLVIGFIGGRFYLRSEEGALWWDKKRLHIPVIGSIFERIALGRFSRALAMMIAAGVPILQSLNIVADSVGNRYIGAAIRRMQSGVERGDRLTNTAAATGLFTPLVLQMMSVGEETGAIDQLLNEVADFYEQEIDYELKQVADAVEPILLTFMGVLVLILALGVFLPVWDLGSVATGGK